MYHGVKHFVGSFALGEQQVAFAIVALRHERLKPIERRLAANRVAYSADQHQHLIKTPGVERQRRGLQQHRRPGMQHREIDDQKPIRGMARMPSGTMVRLDALATVSRPARL